MDVQRKQANDRKIDLIADFSNVLGNSKLVCDEQRIKQVLLGLQSNALKFTERGYVKIIVKREFESDREFLKICVEDTGIGIQREDQKKLFKLFGFLQDTKKLNTKGVGMGLVISDQIVEKFNGKVTFTSVPGVGSSFTFTFELTKKPDKMDVKEGNCRYMLDQKQFYFQLTHLDTKVTGFKLRLEHEEPELQELHNLDEEEEKESNATEKFSFNDKSLSSQAALDMTEEIDLTLEDDFGCPNHDIIRLNQLMEIRSYQAQPKGFTYKILLVDDQSFNIEALKIIIFNVFQVNIKKHVGIAYSGIEAINIINEDIETNFKTG